MDINQGYIIEILGMSAGVLTTLSNFPQLIKLYRTRLGRDIAVSTYLLLSAGLALWTIYGALSNSISLIVTSIASLITTLTIVHLKYKWDKINDTSV